jgi:hopanoid biosynthesis associated protein HpnK
MNTDQGRTERDPMGVQPRSSAVPAGIRLIVNADDFGLSESVNDAVLQAFDRGILTSCSLMVGEPAAEAAVRAARERPGLGVGLHVTTVCGHPVLPARAVPRLLDREGRLPDRPASAGLRYALDRETRDQLKRELRAQFERFRALGLPLSHVDGHLHMHMHPFVFDQVAALAEEFGCRCLRIPRDDWRAYRREEPWAAPAQAPLAAIFALLARRARRRLAGQGFVWADSVTGFYRTDRMDERALLALLDRLRPGTHELYSHPDAGGRGAAGDRELAALLSPAVRERIEARRIHCVTYRELEKTACR